MNITPEMMQKIQEIMGGGEGMDEEAICQIIRRELMPLVGRLDQIIEELDGRLKKVEHDQLKFITDFGSAIDEHKKRGLTEMLSSKFSPDLDALSGPYGDFNGGRKLGDDLMEILMESDDEPEGIAGNYMTQLRGIYGKHIPSLMPPASEEPAPEGEVAPEAAAETAPEPGEKPKGLDIQKDFDFVKSLSKRRSA